MALEPNVINIRGDVFVRFTRQGLPWQAQKLSVMKSEPMSAAGPRPIITLLTDFGTADVHVGIMRAVIFSICPEANVVDLTHQVPPQDIARAAFLLETAWRQFPVHSIHVGVIDPEVGSARRGIALDAGGHYFVGPDNGLFSYVTEEAGAKAVALTRPWYFLGKVSHTFHARDVFAPVAAHLARGIAFSSVGDAVPLSELQRLPVSRPSIQAQEIEAHVIHVDRFGNLITDLKKSELAAWLGKGIKAHIQAGPAEIKRLSRFYAEVEPGQPLALISSSDRVEISVNLGSASQQLGLGPGSVIRITKSE